MLKYFRVIACSWSTFGQPFSTNFPSIEDELPSELELLDQNPPIDTNVTVYQPLGDLFGKSVGTYKSLISLYFSMRINEQI